MVVFNELRITPKGEALIIDLHIRKDIMKDWPNASIKSISICDSTKYTEGGIPQGAVEIYNSDNITQEFYKKILPSDSIDFPATFKDKLLFIYVTLQGVDETALTCGCNNKNPSIGVAIDMGLIYNQFMKYINELNNTNGCFNKTPTGFIDFILRYNALLLAMDSKHYKKGIDFFDKWFSGKNSMVTSDCGCHG